VRNTSLADKLPAIAACLVGMLAGSCFAADKAGPRIELGEPVVVAESPPQYATDPSGKWWGFFQFPGLWRGDDGVLFVSVHIGADSVAGRHEPTQFYSSRDGGRSWQQVGQGADGKTPARPPESVALPDGRQVVFGERLRLDDVHGQPPEPRKDEVDLDALGVRPVAGPFRDGYTVNEYLVYRHGDIPAAGRTFPLAVRANPDAAWEPLSGSIEWPDLRQLVLTRAMWWDDAGKPEWLERPRRLKLPIPHGVLVLPDGTLLWALDSQHPEVGRRCGMVSCLASSDAGRTWTRRGTVAEGRDWTWGATEEISLARMPDGDLLCVIRTKASGEANDTHFLAAARSSDQGRTWTPLHPLAEFSVTPHLISLANGTVAVVYGRPGVHVKASADSGRTWSEAAAVIGPNEKDVLAKPLGEWWPIRHDFSCANSSVAVTGPDRFLVAYSDFRHRNAAGERCKAICVREVRVVGAGL
jgi:hypothetical protein